MHKTSLESLGLEKISTDGYRLCLDLKCTTFATQCNIARNTELIKISTVHIVISYMEGLNASKRQTTKTQQNTLMVRNIVAKLERATMTRIY